MIWHDPLHFSININLRSINEVFQCSWDKYMQDLYPTSGLFWQGDLHNFMSIHIFCCGEGLVGTKGVSKNHDPLISADSLVHQCNELMHTANENNHVKKFSFSSPNPYKWHFINAIPLVQTISFESTSYLISWNVAADWTHSCQKKFPQKEWCNAYSKISSWKTIKHLAEPLTTFVCRIHFTKWPGLNSA